MKLYRAKGNFNFIRYAWGSHVTENSAWEIDGKILRGQLFAIDHENELPRPVPDEHRKFSDYWEEIISEGSVFPNFFKVKESK